ncbi:aldehyde dehydrogenase [Calothrix rhizosoleniae]|uniref:aldehyde dehydrogenase n=1 Tax=Calothrix rhizosoleniae TaxID=888997 RepID=UPI000B4A4661|nr:aldehyde dehydrogenase [Calothrix rhizosoleniae]
MISNTFIGDIIHKQRDFFATGNTKNINFRIQQLKKLKQIIMDSEESIYQALKLDLNKPQFESFATEIVLITKEIDYTIKHLKTWVKAKKVQVYWQLLPASAKVYPEPLGVVLIIGAWNYPFLLAIEPLIGAIAAGNCAIIKPSELAPHTSTLIAEMIGKHFPPEYIAVVEGGVETSQDLLQERFDHIFFTGGKAVGKIVMTAAAKHLTPVTLELGGKSPCIVDRDIDMQKTAKRIIWGKFINAGQTCLAPDYLLVNSHIKEDLLIAIKQNLQLFYGENPQLSSDYPRNINTKHFQRLEKFLQSGEIIIGGDTNKDELYISPTVIDHVNWDDAVMQDEIFGPILPIITYTDISAAIATINSHPKPLALYLFSRDQNLQKQVLQSTSSGGVCINETVMHCSVPGLPFGGVGDSGIGRYHGKASFDTFSHYKSTYKNPFWVDINWRYPPYKGKLSFLKQLLRF